MSLLPCCRYHPVGMRQTQRPVFVCLCCLCPLNAGSTSETSYLRGHLCVYFHYGLVTCSSPFKVTLSIGFKDFGFPYLCYSSCRVSGFYPGETLSPTEHISLIWTHIQTTSQLNTKKRCHKKNIKRY